MKRILPDKFRGLSESQRSKRNREHNSARHIGRADSIASLENLYSPNPHVLPQSEVNLCFNFLFILNIKRLRVLETSSIRMKLLVSLTLAVAVVATTMPTLITPTATTTTTTRLTTKTRAAARTIMMVTELFAAEMMARLCLIFTQLFLPVSIGGSFYKELLQKFRNV